MSASFKFSILVQHYRVLLYRASLLLPSGVVLGYDALARASRMTGFSAYEWWRYIASFALSAALWGRLLHNAAHTNGRLRLAYSSTFGLFYTIALGGQRYSYQQNHAYITREVAQFATDFRESVVNQLLADLPNYLWFKVPALASALFMLFLSRRLANVAQPLRSRQPVLSTVPPVLSTVPPVLSTVPPVLSTRQQVLAPLALLLAFFAANQTTVKQASMPDMLYMEALGEMGKTQLGFGKYSNKLRPGVRHSKKIRPLIPRLETARNVVLVILESVRKDATCAHYDPNCKRTPFTNSLLKNRISLSQMRATDSCTIVSMGVLLAGVSATESREVLHNWPLLFDYAKAAGYHTAYLTSQNLMFGNLNLWLKNLDVDVRLSALDVDPEAHLDLGVSEAKFASRAVELIKQLKSPYFMTIQLSNAHYPYLVDPQRPQPFQPASSSKAPDDNHAFFNHYQNAVYQQDEHLAQVLRAVRSAPGGERSVIVYTSDHGEAFREHHQMGHTVSVYDEELLVPAFIDAPPLALKDDELIALRSNQDRYLFHPDLFATVLDLLGIWDEAALLSFKSKMLGRSLLRPAEPSRVVPLSNCTELWSCAFENWGMMRDSLKLQAREWDADYRCFDVHKDPTESNDLGPAACQDLRLLAKQRFGRLPGRHDRPTSSSSHIE